MVSRRAAAASQVAQSTPVNRDSKMIVVCGDLVWDTHIARLPFSPRGYFQPHLQSQLDNRHGGAWYLRDVIKGALDATRNEADQTLADGQSEMKAAQRQTNPMPSKRLLKKRERAVNQEREWAAQSTVALTAPVDVGYVEIEESQKGGIAKGFSVWEWFDSKEKPARAKIGKYGTVYYTWRDGKAQPGTWRTKEFLGCQEPLWGHEKGCPVVDYPGRGRLSTSAGWG
jgi:hypothetical protein